MKTKLLLAKSFTLWLLLLSTFFIYGQNPNIYASAVWIDDCTTVGDGKFFNTSGSGADLINQEQGNTFVQNFGVHLQNANTLILRGAEVKTQKDNNTNVCSTTLFYRFFENTQTPGAFQSMSLPFFSDCNTAQNEFFVGSGPCQSGQQKWQRVVAEGTTTPFAPIDLTNTPPGNYILQVYYEFTGSSTSNNECNQTFVLNNSGDFFQATFTIIGNPGLTVSQPTDCDGLGSFTITGLTANAPYEIRYNQNGTLVGPLPLITNANGQITIADLPLGTYTNITIISNGCNIVLPNTVTLVNPVFTPIFDAIPDFCIGDAIDDLPLTSVNGFTGTWSPEINNQQTTIYTFTPDPNQCAELVTLTITITPLTIPTFTAVAPICEGETLDALATTSNNGITGIWAPELDNTQTTTYTFTPDDGQCADVTTLTIVVNDNILPEFSTVTPICVGENLQALPTTSLNGILGTWSPELDNTQTTVYTFTPNPGICALETTLTIEVNPLQTPDFDISTVLCEGQPLDELPLVSLNGISGSWSPAINPNQTTTYTFTPDPNQCADAVSVTIQVLPVIVPQFDAVSPICVGENLNELPSISLNGISGVWTPTLNNQQTTTYTFSPNEGQCATTVTLTINVIEREIPTFDFGNTVVLCEGDDLFLSTTSVNGIAGTWSPSVVNSFASGTYVFTPVSSVCAEPFTLNVVIEPQVEVSLAFGCEGNVFTARALTNSSGVTFQWLNVSGVVIGTGDSFVVSNTGDYFVVALLNNCTFEIPFTVSSTFCDIPRGISPNNDGLNDAWDLSNLDIRRAQIFNRYGMEVFSRDNYTNEWDGRDKRGKNLPSGTYYYMVTFGNGAQKTGWVYLQREE